MDEELSGTDSDNTAEYREDEFENVEVEATESEAGGWSYDREDNSLEPYSEEPLEEKNG